MKLTAAIPLVVLCLAGDVSAQHVTRPAAKPPAARPQRPERPPEKAEAAAAAANNPGSAENLSKLLKMTPEQRNKALSALNPARRAQIEKRLGDYQKLPPDQQARELDHLRRMQSLPPQKQQQVRASLQQLAALPQPRKAVVNRQINQMRPLADPDRRAMMNSEEFRNKFTPSEQQMIEDISMVTPVTAPRAKPPLPRD
jgi:hypothetical protein